MDNTVKLAETGYETYIESVNHGIGHEQERRVTTRRIRFRRVPRLGAIVPDRRRTPSRRKEDLVVLEKYGDSPATRWKNRRVDIFSASSKAELRE